MPDEDDELLDQIIENAAAPAKASGDAGSVEQHPLRDQIEFDKYRRSREATRAGAGGLGIRFVKLIPPGAD